MSYTYYASTDAGAPVLNGSAGSLIDWFDTICVGTGTAYGSKPKKGWTKAYSGTSKAVYRTNDGGAYYRVVHDGSHSAAGTREALVRGAESASGVDSLADPFPLTAQVADASCCWRISDTADSTARAWVAIVGPDLVILRAQHGSTDAGTDCFLMGKYAPKKGGNAWPYLLSVRNANNTNTSGGVAFSVWIVGVSSSMSGSLYGMRTPSGALKSPQMGLIASVTSSNRVGAATSPEMPDADGDVNLLPATLICNNSTSTASSGPVVAGVLPCLWDPQHGQLSLSVARDDTFSSAAYNPAATFAFWCSAARGTGNWRCVAEISDTWLNPYG